MKLWLKISLLSATVTTAAVCVCSIIMLINSRESNLNLAIQNALTNQQVRAASWITAIESKIDEDYTPEAQRSLASYLIGRFADSRTVLATENDMIYNAGQIDPRPFLSAEENAQQYIIQDLGGKSLLVVGSSASINGIQYRLYTINDISNVFSDITNMSYQFAVVNLLVVVGMVLITIVIVKKVLSPISILKENSALIAGGIYDKRIVVSGQDEVAELAENFNQMAEAVMRTVTELHEEVDRRTLFMSAITHELKTPLTSIKGNAQTLLATKMNEEEREDALLRINDACTHMEHLSQKLTQLIVMRQSGDIALTLGSVSELLSGVEKSCSERLKNAGISLIIENHMDVLPMDCDLLSSLLTNLVDNAAKASLPGGNIILRAEAGIISVKDTGKGIPKDELPKITQPFYMVDKSRAKKTGGMGLGLAICEEIARLHGARLVFESEVDNGTTAKVVFNYEKTVGIP